LLLSLPFLIAAYRKLKALSMLLAEMGVKPEMAGRHTQRVRRVIAEVIPILSLLVIFLLLAALSASILPTNKLLVLIAVVGGGGGVLWRWFIRVHTRMQVALLETLDNHKDRRSTEALVWRLLPVCKESAFQPDVPRPVPHRFPGFFGDSSSSPDHSTTVPSSSTQ
jgi:hypothetical protein